MNLKDLVKARAARLEADVQANNAKKNLVNLQNNGASEEELQKAQEDYNEKLKAAEEAHQNEQNLREQKMILDKKTGGGTPNEREIAPPKTPNEIQKEKDAKEEEEAQEKKATLQRQMYNSQELSR